MPASLTRVCPVCITERNTPADFRDLGEVGPGRPPVICRECRDRSAALTARQQENVTKRAARRAQAAAFRARTFGQVLRDQRRHHPDGRKTCPELAGCGRALPLIAFTENRSLYDGLESVCIACKAEHRAIRS